MRIVINNGVLSILDETGYLFYFHVYDSTKQHNQEAPTAEEVSIQTAFSKYLISNI